MGKHRFCENNLSEFLKEIGMSQGKLAKACGFVQQRVSQWCSNKVQMPVWAAKDMAEILGADPAYLLGLTDYPVDAREVKEKAHVDLEESMSFSYDFYLSMSELSQSDRGRLMDAMCDFYFKGEYPKDMGVGLRGIFNQHISNVRDGKV